MEETLEELLARLEQAPTEEALDQFIAGLEQEATEGPQQQERAAQQETWEEWKVRVDRECAEIKERGDRERAADHEQWLKEQAEAEERRKPPLVVKIGYWMGVIFGGGPLN